MERSGSYEHLIERVSVELSGIGARCLQTEVRRPAGPHPTATEGAAHAEPGSAGPGLPSDGGDHSLQEIRLSAQQVRPAQVVCVCVFMQLCR